MFGMKGKWNLVLLIFMLTITTVFIVFITNIYSLPTQYEEYSYTYVEDVKSEIDEALMSENYIQELLDIKEEFNFDAIIFEEETVIFTTNKIYDIEYAESVYSDGYIHKGSYITDDYFELSSN